MFVVSAVARGGNDTIKRDRTTLPRSARGMVDETGNSQLEREQPSVFAKENLTLTPMPNRYGVGATGSFVRCLLARGRGNRLKNRGSPGSHPPVTSAEPPATLCLRPSMLHPADRVRVRCLRNVFANELHRHRVWKFWNEQQAATSASMRPQHRRSSADHTPQPRYGDEQAI